MYLYLDSVVSNNNRWMGIPYIGGECIKKNVLDKSSYSADHPHCPSFCRRAYLGLEYKIESFHILNSVDCIHD